MQTVPLSTNGIMTMEVPSQTRRFAEAPPLTLGMNLTDGRFSDLDKTNPDVNQSTQLYIKDILRMVENYKARCQRGGRGETTYTDVDASSSATAFDNTTVNFLARTWDHPQLISRAMFALAISFAVLRMLPYCVISNLIGPLQISLVSMIMRTVHFFIVVGTVLVSFAVGLTLTYSHYSKREEGKVESFKG